MDEKTRQNLVDAGCSADFIKAYAALNKPSVQIRKLREHRRLLLSAIHDTQNKLDCLDYLIYTKRKQTH